MTREKRQLHLPTAVPPLPHPGFPEGSSLLPHCTPQILLQARAHTPLFNLSRKPCYASHLSCPSLPSLPLGTWAGESCAIQSHLSPFPCGY